ncbi:ABC transporter ATP-binding protein [Ilumatobacter sp.]|uniref:ABC transporter ATP-binding protein n=1 Tax=Ilumatobacter sp. TaxID=1967498 RepID=UPI0037514E4E
MRDETKQPADDFLLSVDNLKVEFYNERGTVHAVQDVSLGVRAGETLGLVGESGSGKSVTAAALMDLVPITGRVANGTFRWHGREVTSKELGRLRGSKITMVFQDPMSALNPLVHVGAQITEVLRKHLKMSRGDARRRALELFDLVGIPEPLRRFKQYPFEFSGGMAQRVVIAMALAAEPEVLIADEPTTALDVTIQAQILDLIAHLQKELNIAIVLITHDLGVVAGVADHLAVMYAGRVVESGVASEVFEHPSHPYMRGLLASTPHPREVTDRLVPIPGNPPVVTKILPGCAFADRCSEATDRCRTERPELVAPPEDDVPSDRKVACWHAA